MSLRPERLLIATLVCLTWLAGSPGLAQDHRVNATIQPKSGITETQPVRLVIRIDGDPGSGVKAPRLSGLVNLAVIAGPRTENKFRVMNGRISSTTEFTYTLVPDKAGPAEIPSLAVTVDGIVYRTAPIRFSVAPSATGRRPGEDLILEAALGTEEVWVGQTVPLTVTLLTTRQVAGWDYAQQPNLGDFLVETIRTDPNAESYKKSVSGRNYRAFPLDRRMLVPLRAGTFELGSFTARIRVQRKRNDPFDLFSFGRNQQEIRKTRALSLRVRPLPTAGKPADFSGAVGSFRLTVTLDREQAQVNDAVALTATVEGKGSLRSVDPPRLDAPADVNVFEPRAKASRVDIEQGRVVSRKTWEWLLVPLLAGEVQLPDLHFSYFEPQPGVYRDAGRALIHYKPSQPLPT